MLEKATKLYQKRIYRKIDILKTTKYEHGKF